MCGDLFLEKDHHKTIENSKLFQHVANGLDIINDEEHIKFMAREFNNIPGGDNDCHLGQWANEGKE